MHTTRISRPLLADAVRDQLLAAIVAGEFPPGHRLNVDGLAAAFGVSRTPIREALARLAQTQMVDIARNSSMVVASWGVDDMRQRAKVAGDLGAPLDLYVSSRQTSAHRQDDALREALGELRDAATSGDRSRIATAVDAGVEAFVAIL